MSEFEPGSTPPPEKEPTPPSPELQEAMDKVKELEEYCEASKEYRDEAWQNNIEIWGSEEAVSPAVRSYFDQVEAILVQKQAELVEAKALAESLEAGTEDDDADEEQSTALERAATLAAAADKDPQAKEKKKWYQKIGRKPMAIVLGGIILVGAGAVGGDSVMSNNDEEKVADTGVIQEYVGAQSSDLLNFDLEAGDKGIESIGEFEVVNYGFFDANKIHPYDMGPPGEVLDENGNLRGETQEEQRQMVLDEWETIGKEDPHRIAMAYISLIHGGDYENHDIEALEAQYIADPGARKAAYEEVMGKLQDGEITMESLEGKSYYSMYNVLGKDGTPELVQSYIADGEGYAAVIKTEVNGKIVKTMWRANCGWQDIVFVEIPGLRVVNDLPEVTFGGVSIRDLEDSGVRTPNPEEPVPEIPEPETPGPEEPEPEPEEPTSKPQNPDEWVGVGDPVPETDEVAETAPPVVESPVTPDGEAPVMEAPEISNPVPEYEDIEQEVVDGGEAGTPEVEGETEGF